MCVPHRVRRLLSSYVVNLTPRTGYGTCVTFNLFKRGNILQWLGILGTLLLLQGWNLLPLSSVKETSNAILFSEIRPPGLRMTLALANLSSKVLSLHHTSQNCKCLILFLGYHSRSLTAVGKILILVSLAKSGMN